MVKLPISETALKYYEETGYQFSFKEQAHLCYHYAPGLLKRIDALKEILEKSDDEKLNKDISAMVDYEFGIYSKFIDNENGRYIYVLEENYPDGRKLHHYFRSIEKALSYAEGTFHYESQVVEISKVLLIDDFDDTEDSIASKLKYNANGEIIEYCSWEYEDDYEPGEYVDFINRFDNMFMKIDCPFELGDIVISPDHIDPLIVLSDKDIFHKKYEATKMQYGDDVKTMLEYTDNCIPVLEYNPVNGIPVLDDKNGLSVTYIRPFLLEKIDHNEGYNEEFWDMLLIISKMVKCKYDLDTIRRQVYSERRYRLEFGE